MTTVVKKKPKADAPANPYEVTLGQEWESTDKRTPGRRVRVTYVGMVEAEVQASAPASNDSGAYRAGRKTKIRLDRFRPGSTGWQLVAT